MRQNPGICVADAARQLGIAWNAAQLLPETPERTRDHHIQRLLGAGAISQEITPEGKKRLRIEHGRHGPALLLERRHLD